MPSPSEAERVITPQVLRDWPLPDPQGGKEARGTVLVVAVDDPSWATQLRWLEADLVARICAELGAGVVTGLDLVVRPGSGDPAGSGPRGWRGDHGGPARGADGRQGPAGP